MSDGSTNKKLEIGKFIKSIFTFNSIEEEEQPKQNLELAEEGESREEHLAQQNMPSKKSELIKKKRQARKERMKPKNLEITEENMKDTFQVDESMGESYKPNQSAPNKILQSSQLEKLRFDVDGQGDIIDGTSSIEPEFHDKEVDEVRMEMHKRILPAKLKKALIISGVLALMGLVVGILFIFPCEVFGKNCPVSVEASPLIVNRKFNALEVYVANYMTATKVVSQDQNSQGGTENQTIYYCVREVRNDSTDFVGYYKKVLSFNDTYVQEYESQPGLEVIIAEVANSSSNANSQPSNITNLSDIPYNFTMFLFTLANNGTILTISFITQSDLNKLSNLPKMIKMFSPLLAASLYQNSSRRMLQADNSTAQYNANQTSNGTDLNSNTQKSENSDTQNSQQKSSTTSNFDNDGNLKNAKMGGDASLESASQPPSDEFRVVNLNCSVKVSQNASLEMANKYTVQNNSLNAFLTYYEEFEGMSKTLTLSLDQFNEYIINASTKSPGDVTAPSRRRLFEMRLWLGNDYLTLIDYTKSVKAFSSNVLGCTISMYAFFTLNLRLYEIDYYKKQPYLQTAAGLQFNFGAVKIQIKIINYERSFEPLTLTCTLDKIIQTLADIKDEFETSIDDVQYLSSIYEYQRAIQKQLSSVIDASKQAISEVSRLETALLPLDTINEILTIFDQMYTEFSSLASMASSVFQFKRQLVDQIRDDLYAYANLTYKDAIAEFRLIQTQFRAVQTEGVNNFVYYVTTVENHVVDIINAEKQLLTADIVAMYQAEIAKAQPFFDFIHYVEVISSFIQENLTLSYDMFDDRFNNMSKSMLDLCFMVILNATDHLESEVHGRTNELSNYLNNVDNEMKSIVAQMNSTLQYRFTLLNIPNLAYTYDQFNNLIDIINPLSSQPENLKYGCGSWGDYWWHYPGSCFEPLTIFVDAADQAVLEHTTFFELYLQINLTYYNAWHQLEKFQQKYNSIANGNETIDRKYALVALEMLNFQFWICTSCSENVNDYLSHLNHQYDQLISSNVSCGGHCQENERMAAADAYLSIIGAVDDLKVFIDSYNNFSEVLTYKNSINSLRDFTYSFIVSNANSLNSNVVDFKNAFLQMDNDVITAVDKLFSLSLVNIEVFLGDERKRQEVVEASESIMDLMGSICDQNETKKSEIDWLRSNFSLIYNKTEAIQDSYLADYLNLLMDQTANYSQVFLETYRNFDFCDPINHQITNTLTQVNNQLPYFDVLFTLKKNLLSYNLKNKGEVSDLMVSLQKMLKNRYKIYNEADFESFISACRIFSMNFTDLILEYSFLMSSIKLDTNLLYKFNITSFDEITGAIDIFNSTYVLINNQVYGNLTQMIIDAMDCLQSLNYDILKIYIFLSWNIEYMDDSLNFLVNGSTLLNNTYFSLTDSFMNLGDSVEQDQLNDLFNTLITLTTSFNSTVFPQLPVYQDIKHWFSNVTFNSISIQGIYTAGDSMLDKFQVDVENDSRYYYSAHATIMQKAEEMIKTIKIGLLNDIIEIGLQSHILYSKFFDHALPSQLLAFDSFKTLIKSDFLQATKIEAFIQNIIKLIKADYNKTVVNISSQINHRLSNLQQNPDFFQTFSQSPPYNPTLNLVNNLQLDFNVIYQSVLPEINRIGVLTMKLTPANMRKLEILSTIKSNISSLRLNLTTAKQNVEAKFREVENVFLQAKALTFSDILGDIDNTALPNLNLITAAIRSIVNQQAKNLRSLSKIVIPSEYPTSQTHSHLTSQTHSHSTSQPFKISDSQPFNISNSDQSTYKQTCRNSLLFAVKILDAKYLSEYELAEYLLSRCVSDGDCKRNRSNQQLSQL